jgi:signal transduction histidine kinase
MGLTSAIPWYLEGFAKRSQIKMSFEVAPDLKRLPRPVELALFRVLQESLTNVHRHSESETAQIRLFEERGSVVLEIEDEGKGFPPAMLDVSSEDLPSAFGVGLRGMNERVRELGGTLELKPTKKGAVVRAVVPRTRVQSEIEQQNITAEERTSAA